MPGIRPREFDEDQAVHAAMEVFWRRGYEGTTLPHLIDDLGIARQSLYNAFGSKRGLLLRGLSHYSAQRIEDLQQSLIQSDSPLANLRGFVASWKKHAGNERRGCLMCNITAEVGAADKEIAAAVSLHVRRFEESLSQVVELAKQQRELYQHTNSLRVARTLVALSFSAALFGRLPSTKAFVADVILQADQMLLEMH